MNKFTLPFFSLLLINTLNATDMKAAKPLLPTATQPSMPGVEQDEQTMAASIMGAKEMMIIPPQARAQDFKEAFDLLKKVKSQDKITFFLKDKSKISGILDVDVLPGGTMINFKVNTTQGVRYQIVRVEDINSVML